DASRERNGPPLLVANREHHAIAKLRVNGGVWRGAGRPRPGVCFRFRCSLLLLPRHQAREAEHFFICHRAEPIPEQESRIGSIANAEAANRVLAQSTAGQILARPRAFRTAQVFFEKRAGFLVQIEQNSSLFCIGRFARSGVGLSRHWNPHLLCDPSYRFGKADVFYFLNEAEDIARSRAAKTVKELPRRVHGERRRFLLVERTKPGKILRAGFLELNVVADNADDVRLLL